MAHPRHATKQIAALIRFKVDDFFGKKDHLAVPLLRLMAATNDARHLMTLVIRALHGGRQPRNVAERKVAVAEQSYLVRMLCGHLYEAGLAFRTLWNKKKTQERLKKAIALDPAGQAKLEIVLREFLIPPLGDLQDRVLAPIRNHWAFHYLDQDYRSALASAEEQSHVLIATSRGLSRYLIIDDFVTRAVQGMSSGTVEAYKQDVRRVTGLAAALGVVVDAMLLGLLHEKGVDSFSRRDLVMTMDRGLATGYRNATQRRLDREGP